MRELNLNLRPTKEEMFERVEALDTRDLLVANNELMGRWELEFERLSWLGEVQMMFVFELTQRHVPRETITASMSDGDADDEAAERLLDGLLSMGEES